MELTLRHAQLACSSAMRRATQLGFRASVCIVDPLTQELLSSRDDGASWFTLDVARAKAKTAAAFRRTTSELENLRSEFPDVFDLASEALPFRPTSLAGGLPIYAPDRLLGAIGVSGGLPAQDEECARSATASVRRAVRRLGS
ncbi:hypothetical protein GCM10027416_02190 [Okibacterium endophyticum]